jgi:hypothetical protein
VSKAFSKFTVRTGRHGSNGLISFGLSPTNYGSGKNAYYFIDS